MSQDNQKSSKDGLISTKMGDLWQRYQSWKYAESIEKHVSSGDPGLKICRSLFWMLTILEIHKSANPTYYRELWVLLKCGPETLEKHREAKLNY